MKQKKICVFVVDDEESIGSSLATLLSSQECEVKTFVTGRRALSMAEQEMPQIVFIDYILPGENTEDIIEKFRKIKHPPRIILMSAHLTAGAAAVRLHVDKFLPKPFQLDSVLSSVKMLRV